MNIMMKKYFFLLLFTLALSGFGVAQAADSGCSGFQSQFNFLGSQGNSNVDPTAGLPKICTAASAISWATSLALGFAGIIAVVFVIVGGYMYLTSGGNEEAAEKGRKVLTNSIIGLIIIILSATIIRVVVNTLDSSTGSTPSVTSTINYGGEVTSSTPSNTGGGNTGGGNTGVAALSQGVNISTTAVTASIDQANAAAIKSACGVQNIGSNVALRADVDGVSVGTAPLVLQGSSYTATLNLPQGSFDKQTQCLTAYICNQAVAEGGSCGQ